MRPRRQVRWILCAVAVWIVSWGSAWRVVVDLNDPYPDGWYLTDAPPPRPLIDERHEVQDELDPAEGPLMALPMELPPGYGLPEEYSATSEYHARGFAGEFILGKDERALARHAHIPPATNGTGIRTGMESWWSDPGSVSLCVEYADGGESWCPALPGRDLVRTVGSVRVVIEIGADAPPGTREAWQPIKFTTDLDEVSWLH
ncbi:hypothetical protein [Actinopolymorpha pittospori]|uniref:Uncharacterized protein n=1 Tax=Actinopolymorpha pittospori TaxID=648752 RepID=A0A927RIR0_9ACTN|nr:hypothetical protein [Actinopolymorpha pittospori]MBE1606451.1 hypothetical protein [Actinopolymorpha pittospori]